MMCFLCLSSILLKHVMCTYTFYNEKKSLDDQLQSGF